MNNKRTLYALSNGRTLAEQMEHDGDVFAFNFLAWRSGMVKRFVREQADEFHDWCVATVAMDTVMEERHNT